MRRHALRDMLVDQALDRDELFDQALVLLLSCSFWATRCSTRLA
jgi:hypothetical protein